MTKKIIVESCRECHLKEYRGGSDEPSAIFCINKLTYGMRIDSEYDIPDWCELEDN